MTAEGSSESFRLGKNGPTPEQYAAWKGASMAFGKPPVKPKPQINASSGTNAALAAATKVGAKSQSTSVSRTPSMTRLEHSGEAHRLSYQRSGGSNAGSSLTPDFDRRFNHLDRSNGFLQPQDQSKSPSYIAATLAASRSVTPNHTGQQQQQQQVALQRQSSFTRQPSARSLRSVSSRTSLDQPLDTTSIPPTNSLIGMFEQNAAPKTKKTSPTRRPASTAKEIVSPKAQNPKTPRPRAPSPRVEKPQPEIRSPKPIIPPNFSNKPREGPMSLPAPRKSSTSVKSDPPKQLRAVRKTSITASKPIPIPSKPRPRKVKDNDGASSDDSFVSADDYQPSLRATLQSQNRRHQSNSGNSTVTVDSLANAIVASSLASSRAASPSRSNTLYPPPPPPRRNHHLFHNSKEISRTPSPAKGGLRTTMRKPKEESEDEGEKRRSKKSLMKKHPHKHHEGDRKRWRDELTERERKRYEAVWASNKGLYTSGVPGAENSVCSLVARDIYSRSRLHADVLEEVYALIDRQGNGMLGKEEFVVGLWLIDQRLKGRKLPIRVTDSVWRSVGVLIGIKVRKVK